MRDQSDTDLIEFHGWTLRVRLPQVQPSRQLLLIHGWTGNEDSMWVFARGLPRDYWVVAPRAPHPTGPSGYSWRVGAPARGSWPTLDDLTPAVEALLAMLESFSNERGLNPQAWDTMGFSQGAVVACTMALLFPERVQRFAMLAGFAPLGAEGVAARRPLSGKRVFVAHGSLDETVDIELGRQAVHLLESAGASVELCEGDVGHKVSADCMRRLQTFFV